MTRELSPAAARAIRRVVLGTVLVALVLVGGTAFRVWQVARWDDKRPVDVVVVLGAAQYDGGPSPIFAARLRHAHALYEEGLAGQIVTVGGNRAGDAFTEAEAIYAFSVLVRDVTGSPAPGAELALLTKAARADYRRLVRGSGRTTARPGAMAPPVRAYSPAAQLPGRSPP